MARGLGSGWWLESRLAPEHETEVGEVSGPDSGEWIHTASPPWVGTSSIHARKVQPPGGGGENLASPLLSLPSLLPPCTSTPGSEVG